MQTTDQEQMLVVPNGTTSPIPDTTFLTHGNDVSFSISELCKHIQSNSNNKLNANVSAISPQIMQKPKTKKRIFKFLPESKMTLSYIDAKW